MPILGDIPILGLMFRHKSTDIEERELLVFITPHIIGNDKADYAGAVPKKSMMHTEGFAPREQSLAVLRKEQIDNMMERWEN